MMPYNRRVGGLGRWERDASRHVKKFFSCGVEKRGPDIEMPSESS